MKRINIMFFSLIISMLIWSSFPSAAQYDPIVYQAQQVLKERGYNPGKPDGLLGKATERAVKYFQVDNDLPVTGKLDKQTKAKLGIASTARSVKRNQQTQKRRLALVIGNSAYKTAPLKNPVNDANDMAMILRKLEFEVVHKANVNQRAMEIAVRDFGRSLHKGGVGLFYYAGHGVQVDGRNYLIPIDAEIESESDVKFEAVNAARVLWKMEDAGNDLNIVFLDACRDNPFGRGFRTSTRGLARMDAPKGSIVVYSTAPGKVAADGEDRNGIYTKYLLKHINIPGLTIEQILKKVRIDVLNETDEKQIPWESSSLTGDFYFASVDTTKPKPPISLSDERAKLERERQELERLKLEIERKKLEAERKRLDEEQKKKTVIASIDPKDREISRDGHYIAYASGVVLDTKSGLEWVAGPDKDMAWYWAKRWVNNLTVSGGGWRMPTKAELLTLYEKGKGSQNKTELLKTIPIISDLTGNEIISVWTFSPKWYFDFLSGKITFYESTYMALGKAFAFAVRSRR